MVGATHPASEKKSRVGITREGVVYELFLTQLPQQAFTAADVVALASSIEALSRMPWLMKIKNKIPTAGVVMAPVVRNAGKSSPNGCGTFGWNWAINWRLRLRAPPSLLLRACPHKRRQSTRLLRRLDMDQ